MFNQLLFNFIFILFPLILYVFYVAHNKNINAHLNSFVLNLVLLTSFYLGLKFYDNKINEIFIVTSIIPLIIAYIRKDKFSVTLLSVIQIVCFNCIFNFNLPFLFFEYLVYFICFGLLNRKLFSVACIIFKGMFTVFQLWQVNYYKDILSVNQLLYILLICFLIYIIYGFIIILMKKAEEILQYHMSIKELEREKQIRNSLFKITHEIKNPMAVCKGYFDMLDMNDDEQIKRYLPIIREEIEHTLLILQDFLSITKVKVEKDIMDINLLVEDVSNSFKPILKHNNIKGVFNIMDEEIYINGDYNRLKQVLINLMKNSIEAISNNGIINITTKKELNSFNIIIEDNGVGMSEEVITHLYEPFYTTKKSGTGLGVALSKEILAQHGASITYISHEGFGTTVTISIPIEKSA